MVQEYFNENERIKENPKSKHTMLNGVDVTEMEQMIIDIKDDPSDKYQLELEEKLELRLTIEGELNTARTEMEEVDHEMRKQEQQRSEREEQLQEVSGRLETQRIAAQEITTLSRTIEEQIVEKGGDLETLLENLADDAEMVDWEEQLQLIGNRINRLGPINLAAIDEYKIESERKDYLDTQNAELEEAMETTIIHSVAGKIVQNSQLIAHFQECL